LGGHTTINVASKELMNREDQQSFKKKSIN